VRICVWPYRYILRVYMDDVSYHTHVCSRSFCALLVLRRSVGARIHLSYAHTGAKTQDRFTYPVYEVIHMYIQPHSFTCVLKKRLDDDYMHAYLHTYIQAYIVQWLWNH
jgi:hypothetical protein